MGATPIDPSARGEAQRVYEALREIDSDQSTGEATKVERRRDLLTLPYLGLRGFQDSGKGYRETEAALKKGEIRRPITEMIDSTRRCVESSGQGSKDSYSCGRAEAIQSYLVYTPSSGRRTVPQRTTVWSEPKLAGSRPK